jgi:hypothetical protein
MPWEQLIAAVAVAALWAGGWLYGTWPERRLHSRRARPRVPFAG